jgi:Phosphomethylpyrimidine kinase
MVPRWLHAYTESSLVICCNHDVPYVLDLRHEVRTAWVHIPLQIVEALAARLDAAAGSSGSKARPLLVVDPVLVATSGDALAAGGVMEAMRQHLLPAATIVTPNVPEASALLGSTLPGMSPCHNLLCAAFTRPSHTERMRVPSRLQTVRCMSPHAIKSVKLMSSGPPVPCAVWRTNRSTHQQCAPCICTLRSADVRPSRADGRAIGDLEDMKEAAVDLHALGPQWVLVKVRPEPDE